MSKTLFCASRHRKVLEAPEARYVHQRVVAPLMYDRRESIETHHYSHHDHVIVCPSSARQN